MPQRESSTEKVPKAATDTSDWSISIQHVNAVNLIGVDDASRVALGASSGDASAEASLEVAREDTHDGARRHPPPVNGELYV